MNSLVLIGYVSQEVEKRFTQNDTCVVTSNIAVKRSFAKEGQQNTDFVKFTIFGKKAEIFSKYVKKGSRVALSGELRIDKVDTQEGNRYYTSMLVNEFDFLDTKKDDTDDKFTKQDDTTDDFGRDLPF